MKKIIKDTLILTAITLISGLALATVYQITKQPIAQAEAAAELAAYEGVFPEATFETLAPASFDPVAAGVADGEGVTVEAVAAARGADRLSGMRSRSRRRTVTAAISPWRLVWQQTEA